MPTQLIVQVETWATVQDVTRSEAIRQLVELGLTVKSRPRGDTESN